MKNKVVAFSGGRTSGFMLKRLKDQTPNFNDEFYVLFCNTGKERNETLDFVHRVETEWDIPVVWLEYTRVPATAEIAAVYNNKQSQNIVLDQIRDGLNTHWFRVVNYDTAHRNGQPNSPFDELLSIVTALPNVRGRSCSGQLKVRTMRRFLFDSGVYDWDDYIGIRADEKIRTIEILAAATKHRRPHFPLVEWGITEKDVLAFWATNNFDLQLQSYEGNCDLCFLKNIAKRIRLVRERPESVEWWKNWEAVFQKKISVKGYGGQFALGQPFRLVEAYAKAPQQTYFCMEEPDVPCGCADRGFVLTEDEE